MDRNLGDFEKRDDGGASGESDGDWFGALPQDAEPLETPEAIEAAIAEARADIAAGRGIPHAQVAAWLATWGTSDYKPMPAEWLK